MLKNLTISTKITAMVIALVALTVVAISYLSYTLSKQAIERRFNASLTVLTDSRSERIDNFFENIKANVSFLTGTEVLKKGAGSDAGSTDTGGMGFDMGMDMGMDAEETDMAEDTPEEESDPFDMLDVPMDDAPAEEGGFDAFIEPAPQVSYNVDDFLSKIKDAHGYRNILITGQNGGITHSTDPQRSAGSNFEDPDGRTLPESVKGIHVSTIAELEDGEKVIYIGGPIVHESGETSILLIEVSLDPIYNVLSDTTGLGETGELVLARLDSPNIYFLVPTRNDSNRTVKPVNIATDPNKAIPMQKALAGEDGSGSSIDYRDQETLAVWRYIPSADWGLVAKVDTDEIFADARALFGDFLIAGGILLLLALLVSILFSKYLTNPLHSLKSALEMVGNGILPNKVEKQSNDEIGLMAEDLNHLVQTLKKTAHFAQQIGEGNFDANFKPISKDDALGVALVDMRDNLIEAEKRDKERNWIVTGVAEIGEILRAHDNLDDLGDDVIKYILEKIEGVQGAFYVTSEEEDSDTYLEMKACYAYNRKKYMKASFKFAEGLVGQAAAEMDSILRTEIPEDYVTITSGILGDKKPTCILIVPLITEEKVYGVLEFAGFGRFDSSKVKFVEELSVILARTVFNIKVNERTRKLLEESQTMSAELQEKQEILRQNAEEMQATQEELQKSNTKLEEQIEEVNRTQKRMQLLLENASEVITIYEEDETIRYISPSVEPILGYSQKEMMGKSDIDKVHPDMKDEFAQMFKDLLANPDDQITIQYEYQTKEGNYIWIESTGTNFMSNPAIQGLIVNSRDITERRRAEQEQRMRSKMQALSENSLDLITRLEDEFISYINPVIEEYTGKKPQEFINQKMHDAELNEKILEKWQEIFEEVNNTNKKVASEMEFPSEKGDRIMQVNAIPEFDESNDLESVLVVSHDITERKMIELEIQNKNKKIADSINYAKRIQNAILPNNTVIHRVIPDSFILYKPKDVVSGDFPWYVKTGDAIYMAAVDCTGHGVPGALLSLIGYFLLNDIVKSRKISDPGVILDQLDEGVTSTLRQDQDDSKTKDGMDIALCKINMKDRKVEYAGAHRPLYVMKDGEMVQIKGNKFAIGGGIYKNQTNFTNHKLSLKKGDSFYFCSDGYPDQFGGPQNRKYGPKRLRSLIADIHEKPMKEAYKIFDKSWEDWKGNEKQTDDVLLIGIKF